MLLPTNQTDPTLSYLTSASVAPKSNQPPIDQFRWFKIEIVHIPPIQNRIIPQINNCFSVETPSCHIQLFRN